ncbi:jg16180 [Pararge aegeria aegeria]|uniref:Jg16180 protein n=1 Tax=Pararge aegeria aegeria TaxID=348720 RepID=A0A8S4RD20_9NEOP|nr:jg16180 [Pararge aegeria aegeria]
MHFDPPGSFVLKINTIFVNTTSSSPSSSTAIVRPLLDIGLFQAAPTFPILGFPHPVDACHFSEVVAPSSCGASDTPLTDTRSPLEDLSTPTSIGPPTNVTSPLPLQYANTKGYISYFSSLANHTM